MTIYLKAEIPDGWIVASCVGESSDGAAVQEFQAERLEVVEIQYPGPDQTTRVHVVTGLPPGPPPLQ